MASTLSGFDEKTSFWTANPQMKIISPFKEYYKNDKSRAKERSSRIMWAIAMLLEVEDNKLAMYTEEDRKQVIEDDWLSDSKFNWKSIDKLVKAYQTLVLTHAKRALLAQRKKTDERTKFLSSVEYTMGNAKELDTLLANTPKYLDILKKLEDSVKLEGMVGNKKGGRRESLSEQGII